MVVFVVAILESNLERILKQNIYMRIKENSMAHHTGLAHLPVLLKKISI